MWRKLADVIFWLGLSLAFGGLVTVGAIVAPSVFTTTGDKDLNIRMNGIDKSLDMGKQVGGQIFGDILARFNVLEWVTMGLMLVGIVGWFFAHKHVRRSTWVIAILWAMTVGLLAVDTGWAQPRVLALRDTVRKEAPLHAGDGAPAAPSNGWPAREEFDRMHTLDETLGHLRVYCLLGMIIAVSWRGLVESRGGWGHAERGDALRQALRR